jgi:hypothetical protein
MNEADYKTDHRGRLVPKSLIKDVDLLRDDLVMSVVKKSAEVSNLIKQFKELTLSEIRCFCDQSAEKYGVKFGGEKGNIQLQSFDGKYRVLVAISEYLLFDERLQIAKQLIDECVTEWSAGAREEVAALINHAFQVDKKGQINTDRILGLRRLNIQDSKWKQAMEAIGDSITVCGSKSYIRIYEQNQDGEYRQIPLDVSAV